jgi:hypothetical protein
MLAPDTLVMFRHPQDYRAYMRGNGQASTVISFDASHGYVPQLFWRVYAASNDWFEFQLFDGTEYFWLAGDSHYPSKSVFISRKQYDKGCAWRCWRAGQGTDETERYRLYCQDISPADQMINAGALGAPVTLSQAPFEWEVLTFKNPKDLGQGLARLICSGWTLAGNPPDAKPFIVSGIESSPPLREVWSLDGIHAPWYRISVLSDLNGPKYLAGDESSGKVYLSDLHDGNSSWRIERSGSMLFTIRRQDLWLQIAPNGNIEVTNQPAQWTIVTI